ncbi:hypothetical protein B0H13DRAFT_1872840 [Mycena leptocephala]|nr:hypothetical protein B0H13DRAFT_1872840 [Mycena leptocephala]
MHAHGVLGSQTQTDAAAMSEEEMEVFGVDWEALRDDNLMDSREENNPINKESTSWLGRIGPPQNLNEVSVEPPTGPFSAAEMRVLEDALGHLAVEAPNSLLHQAADALYQAFLVNLIANAEAEAWVNDDDDSDDDSDSSSSSSSGWSSCPLLHLRWMMIPPQQRIISMPWLNCTRNGIWQSGVIFPKPIVSCICFSTITNSTFPTYFDPI